MEPPNVHNVGNGLNFRSILARWRIRGKLAEPAREIEVNGTCVRFRLPTSRDLADAVTAPDQSRGVRRLIERCVIEPRLPEELSDDLSKR